MSVGNRLHTEDGDEVMKKIAVIGSISTDFVVTTEALPAQGETVVGQAFETFFGGKGANQAIAMSRAGLEVFMVGAVGADLFGEELVHNLQENGIQTEMVRMLEDVDSGSAHIQLMSGDNRIIIVPGANEQVSAEWLAAIAETLTSMDLVVLQNEIPIETVQAVIDFCFKEKIQVLYNPAPVKEIAESYLEKVTFLTPNEQEAAALFKNHSLTEVLKKYPNKLIVTLGEKGSVFFDGEKEVRVPAKKVKQVIDTTGAGDTFNGYFAKGILTGCSIETSLQLGNMASALAIQVKGAQAGIPMYQKVMEEL